MYIYLLETVADGREAVNLSKAQEYPKNIKDHDKGTLAQMEVLRRD